jgi:uncharacterized UPF0146 family protein
VRTAGEGADRGVGRGRTAELAYGRVMSVARWLALQDSHLLAGDARAEHGPNGLQRLGM